MHPNPEFVASVVRSLEDSFWSFANTHPDTYPSIINMSTGTLEDIVEVNFLRTQCDIEIKKGRFSQFFGLVLYLSMMSSPINSNYYSSEMF